MGQPAGWPISGLTRLAVVETSLIFISHRGLRINYGVNLGRNCRNDERSERREGERCFVYCVIDMYAVFHTNYLSSRSATALTGGFPSGAPSEVSKIQAQDRTLVALNCPALRQNVPLKKFDVLPIRVYTVTAMNILNLRLLLNALLLSGVAVEV